MILIYSIINLFLGSRKCNEIKLMYLPACSLQHCIQNFLSSSFHPLRVGQGATNPEGTVGVSSLGCFFNMSSCNKPVLLAAMGI